MFSRTPLKLLAASAAVLAGFLLLALPTGVLAGLLCNTPKSLPGYSVDSYKDNYIYNVNYWKGRMVSRVLSGGNIAKLGWHSWTDTDYCLGVARNLYDYGPSYGTNRTNWSSTSAAHPIPSCGGRVDSRVYGNHYWETSGGSSTTDAWARWTQLR